LGALSLILPLLEQSDQFLFGHGEKLVIAVASRVVLSSHAMEGAEPREKK
jgi:hypothetical protein